MRSLNWAMARKLSPRSDAILEVLTSDKDAKVREMAAYVLLQNG